MGRTGRAILAGAMAALFGAVGLTAWSICSYATRSDAVPADAAIVLGAATWGDEPSPAYRERINHALYLYRQGYVGKIIFTGAQDDPSEPPESIVAKRYAVAQGIPEGDILVETSSRITEQNLSYAREVAAGAGLHSVLIVSDPLHMKRAMLMAHDLGMDAHSCPTPTTRYRSLGSRLEFLAREVFFYLGYLVYRPFAGDGRPPKSSERLRKSPAVSRRSAYGSD